MVRDPGLGRECANSGGPLRIQASRAPRLLSDTTRNREASIKARNRSFALLPRHGAIVGPVGVENPKTPYKCKQAALGLKVTKGPNAHLAGRWMIYETNHCCPVKSRTESTGCRD